MKETIKRAILLWLTDYELATGRAYGDEDTLDGAAYILFKKILAELN